MIVHRVVQLDQADRSVAAEIRRVMLAAYRVEADLLGVADFVPLHRTTEQIAGADSNFLGVHVDSRLAAVAEIDLVRDFAANIASLVVVPAHFRKGLGRSLVEQVIREYGNGAISVSTGAANVPAIALYLVHGFTHFRNWTTDDGIAMVTLARDSTGP